MSVAIQRATGRRVHASAADKSAAPFDCAGCSVPVVHVSAYWKHKHDPEPAREFQALFKLGPGEENQHGEGCTYTPAGQVQALVAEAKAVEDSIDLFEHRQPNGPIVFRLNIPAEEERREKAGESLGQETDFKTRINQVKVSRKQC